MKISLKEAFLAGLVFTFIGGLIGNHIVSNLTYKEVTNAQGQKATCQVVKYRFWYEIKNCSDSKMNQSMVGLREIKSFKIN
jgi:hypothetical protein